MSNNTIIQLTQQKPKKSATTIMETRIVTMNTMDSWVLPNCQRETQTNTRVIEFAETLKRNGGLIPGIIVLGRLPNDQQIYLVDGNQRRGGCRLSGLTEFISDIREHLFEDMRDLAEEYIRINSQLVRHKVDDKLRAHEDINPMLRKIRESCPIVGYANIRRASTDAPLISMSVVLRSWFGSATETPGTMIGSVESLLPRLDEQEAKHIISFLQLAKEAWGIDVEYYRLWTSLNVVLCMWLFRQLVLLRDPKRRITPLSTQQFERCLMSLSTQGEYLEWLNGRKMSERDRAPCYGRIKTIFVRRIISDTGTQAILPQPIWALGYKRRVAR